MDVIFRELALADFTHWVQFDRKIAKKLLDLISDIKRNPFSGLGKPEALKHNLSGHWSRRITEEHRLVYKIENNFIVIVSCKGHYK